MIIKKIHINGFGKLQNADFDFSEGINIIVGNNESGKSTLHKFIEAMFFGFLKPYAKNKVYTADYERYLPWISQSYSGTVTYSYRGKDYTLFRNFSKRSEKITLTDELTGEDVTHLLGFDTVSRLPEPGKHMGVNKTLFENTVSIAQLQSVTKQELAKETGELLVNAAMTKTSDVSYKRALEELTAKINEVGTKRQSRSKMGLAASRIEELESEYNAASSALKETQELLEKARSAKSSAGKLQLKKEHLEKQREAVRAKAVVEKYEKFLNAKNEALSLKKQLNFRVNLTEEEYERYVSLNAMLKETNEQLENAEEEEKKLKNVIQSLSAKKEKLAQASSFGAQTLKEDSLLFSGILSVLKKIKKTGADEKLDRAKEKITKQNKLKKAFLITAACLTGAGLAVLLVSLFTPNKLYPYSAVLAGLAVLAFVGWYCAFLQGQKLVLTYDKYDTVLQKSLSYEIKCKAQLDALKEKYAADSYAKLRDLFANAESLYEEERKTQAALNKAEAAQNENSRRKAELKAKAEHYAMVTGTILKQAGAKDEEELKQFLLFVRGRGELSARLSACIDTMKECLGEGDEEDLSALAESSKEAAGRCPDGVSIDELERKISLINEQLFAASQQAAELRGRASESENAHRSPNVILEEKAVWEKKLEETRQLSDAYRLAYDTIVKISSEIHGDFAQIFNDYVSEAAAGITGGKYTDVKTDESFRISVRDDATGKIVPAEELSGGAVDQLYFAARFAAAELMLTDKSIPLILDDCFVQYDAERLANALKFISSAAAERQVIMFSCRCTEAEIMRENGIKFKEIKL